MKVEIGKTYLTEGGRKATVKQRNSQNILVAEIEGKAQYLGFDDYGVFLGDKTKYPNYDLVSEYKDDTQMFKVGDRVKKKDGTSFSNYEMFVNVTEVKNGCVWLTTGYHLTPEKLELANEQIVIKEKFVGEQPSSPVQSRKTLVPGVYGRVKINDYPAGTGIASVQWQGSNLFTAQELRDVIRVLGDIVEFLEEVG